MKATVKEEQHPAARKDWQPAIQHVIRSARVEKGYTQKALGVRYGVKFNIWNLVETGNREMSLQEFLRFCDMVGAKHADIVNRIVEWKPPPEA